MFDDGDPTNPLVASERGEAVPFFTHFGVDSKGCAQVGRYAVVRAGLNRSRGHVGIVACENTSRLDRVCIASAAVERGRTRTELPCWRFSRDNVK